ncbi:MAG: hypothetical protein ACRDZ4_20690 [Egibacteraceae bacterium]
MSGITRRWRRVVAAVLVLVAGVVGLLALWATPPIWLSGPQRVAVAALGWAHEHVLTVAVASLVATVVVPVLVRWFERRDAMDDRRRPRKRPVMLKQVRNRWITGVLEQSLTEEVRIALGLARRLDVL